MGTDVANEIFDALVASNKHELVILSRRVGGTSPCAQTTELMLNSNAGNTGFEHDSGSLIHKNVI